MPSRDRRYGLTTSCRLLVMLSADPLIVTSWMHPRRWQLTPDAGGGVGICIDATVGDVAVGNVKAGPLSQAVAMSTAPSRTTDWFVMIISVDSNGLRCLAGRGRHRSKHGPATESRTQDGTSLAGEAPGALVDNRWQPFQQAHRLRDDDGAGGQGGVVVVGALDDDEGLRRSRGVVHAPALLERDDAVSVAGDDQERRAHLRDTSIAA